LFHLLDALCLPLQTAKIVMTKLARHLLVPIFTALILAGCSAGGGGSRAVGGVRVNSSILPPNIHGRLVKRTMRPSYITIHSTSNRGATAYNHAQLLQRKGMRSRNNPRFGRSGWITWHYTVDDRGAYQHLLPTEQGDHADYGGTGDRSSIGIEICEFRNKAQQAKAIDNAARLTASLADQYGISSSRIVTHHHWPRWDYRHGKPCPRILLDRDRHAPGGWREGARWNDFVRLVDRYR
jgi:N-acetylmuramoyl-L-alanine amidase